MLSWWKKDDKQKERAYEFNDLVFGIIHAIAYSKSNVDYYTVKTREFFENAHPLMKLLPLTTFKLDEVEIELKYVIVPLDKDEIPEDADGVPRVKVLPYSEKLAESGAQVQTVKFKLTSSEIKKYRVAGKEQFRVEEV